LEREKHLAVETSGLTLSVAVQVRREEELEDVVEALRSAGAEGTWVQLCLSAEILQQVSVWDLLDPLHDAEVHVASIKVMGSANPALELIEKLAVVASETAGRIAIISASGITRLEALESWLQVFASYQAKLLLEPKSAQETRQLYSKLRNLIGGVLGLSQVQERFPSTEYFLRVLTPYLQITRNVQISNYERGEAAKILAPGVYNNPFLLRVLVSGGYSGQLTIGYEKAPTTLHFLLEERRAVDSFIRSLEEKI